MTAINEQRLKEISALRLEKGSHYENGNKMCVMEAVAYVAGEPWTDKPECVCPVISVFLRTWNDTLTDEKRNELLQPLIAKVVNSHSTPALEMRRSWMALDWLVREYAAEWLRVAELTEHADAVAALDEVKDSASCKKAAVTLNAAMCSTTAQLSTEHPATGSAACTASAGSAALVASVPAGRATLDAAGYEARYAAGCVARHAARFAVDDARHAAEGAEAVTKRLQNSAVALIERMLDEVAA